MERKRSSGNFLTKTYWSSGCINHLKARLTEEWQNFDQKIIGWAIKQWRPRLRECVREQGGHFEHQLYSLSNLLH